MNISTVYSNRSEKSGLLNVAAEIEKLGHTVNIIDAIESDTFPTDKFQEVMSRTQCAIMSNRCDLLLVYGDRYEQLAATCVAHVSRVPIAHIHGGELSIGSFDNANRHAISIMADLHFTATHESAQRLLGFGIGADRIWVTGAPALDNMLVPTLDEFREEYGFSPEGRILVAYHPDSLVGEERPQQLFDALNSLGAQCIFTSPNGEPGSEEIENCISEYTQSNLSSYHVGSMGPFFRTAMKHCAMMVGNSSAGIIEAPSLGCWVVNVGRRQDGRQRAGNVVDVRMDSHDIHCAMVEVAEMGEVDCGNPYKKENASSTIANYIDAIPNLQELLRR